MSQKMINCKACQQEIAASAKTCPHCGAKNKKPIFKKWWFWAVIVVILIGAMSGGGETQADEPAKVGSAEQTENTTVSAETEDTAAPAQTEDTTVPVQTTYCVGDILQDGNMKIVYIASGEYIEENEFQQPDDGYQYIFLKFAFENTSDDTDGSISMYDFECYADGYAADMYYGGEEDLSAVLSAGRITTGYIYFSVPVDAAEIEIEYTTDYFTSDKITFVYEGEKDCGYVPQADTSATPGAYQVGDTAESSNLVITYISCSEYTSDNMFIQPKDGYHFISCEFEFENIGKSDEYISSFDFDCFADGFNCSATYIRDDDLGATLSAGRKVKGTVTFEVPLDATVVEVEFLSNYWTSNRVVFTAQ